MTNNRWVRLIEVNAFNLRKPFCNQTSFIVFDLAIRIQFCLKYPFTVDHFAAFRLGNHVKNILTDELFHFFSTSCFPLSSVRVRHSFCICKWVWINVCNLCWLITHCSGDFDNFLCSLLNGARCGGLQLSRELPMFVGRLLITIIIVMYRLAFEPGRPMDLRQQQVQDSYKDRNVESKSFRFFNSKFSWGIPWGGVK